MTDLSVAAPEGQRFEIAGTALSATTGRLLAWATRLTDGTHPLFRWLKEERSGVLGGAIKWNFTKFLIGKDGQVLDRFAPTTKPEKLTGDIEKALAS